MRRSLAAALLLALSSSASSQVEKAGGAAESSAGPAPSLAGAALTAAPAPVSLSVAPLGAAPFLSATPLPASPALAAAPAAASAPSAPALAPAAAVPEALPVAAAASARETGPAAAPARAGAGTPSREEEDGAGVGEGRALFDAASFAADGSPGLWTRLKGMAGFGERVPAWPGAAGETLRVAKRSFTLDTKLADGVWRTAGGLHVVTLAPPGRTNRAEADALRALEGTDIPHAGLVAVSADGRALVQELIDDDDARDLLARGFQRQHVEGWAELAARLIRAGATGDLTPGNLIWQRWRGRWILSDARGVRRAEPGEVVASLLTPASRSAGVDPAEFLAAVRARLGPDAAEWARTLSALRTPDRAALDAHDRALPPAPRLAFGPAGSAPYPDDAGPAKRVRTALGYDPLTIRPRRMLHADDPGKLNTEVFSVAPPGKTEVAVKIAEWGVVRRELALRRVIRRWFGRWFDSPSAFGVAAGRESYLVMEFKDGAPDHYQGRLPLEQRAALAVLVHAFGIWDVNPGNVLFPARGKPVLLDFEQALSRRAPVASRVPDEGIAVEMPWVSRFEINRAEDYQPAVREWRALLAEPASKAALVEDFKAAGYTAEEAAALLRLVEANTADLDWTIANDVEFANQFVKKRRG
ncbi:MAG TPA: hypothetical protein VN915_07850 [Elusimicrobiota bacterium]|nr:hypothetical protein [Elusimicrobiota bacterium]